MTKMVQIDSRGGFDDDAEGGATATATATAAAPGESSFLLKQTSSQRNNRPLLLHHDSVFSVDSTSYNDPSPNNLNLWQGAALLTADCMGTGILALPGDMHVLGYALGLSFLIANLPINLFAGTILARSATWVEEKQQAENRVFEQHHHHHHATAGGPPCLLEVGASQYQDNDSDDDDNDENAVANKNNNNNNTTDYLAITSNNGNTINAHHLVVANNTQTNNITSIIETLSSSACSSPPLHHHHDHHDHKHEHEHLHHDTATFDFVGMTQAIFKNKCATTLVMMIYYVNIFLVLGNYILVMSHAVSAVFGEEWLCLPAAGLIASTAMFVVSQSRTMARLGRTASVLSLAALFIVVGQCLWAIAQQQQQQHDDDSRINSTLQVVPQKEQDSERSVLRKLSAMGSIGFAVGSQKLFLNIRHEFANRQEAPKSLAISLTAFGTIYVLVVLAAGSNPHGFLFDAIPGGGWNRRIAGFLLWAHVVVSYAINSQAICSSLDRLVWHRLPVGAADAANNGAIRWMLLTGVMAIAAYTVANAIPFFKDLVALIGALTSVPLTLLFPAIFWRRYLQVPIWTPTIKTLCSYGLLAFAGVFTVAATCGAVYSIRQDWKSHGPPFSCH